MADADFCITGYVDPDRQLPEGPFGDHLGYYSLAHDFPCAARRACLSSPGAIWPFTTVGRPPQEDTTFGQFIHELTGPVVPTLVPGVRAVHAVDAAGVHPLLLAIGSERYVPYAGDGNRRNCSRRPMRCWAGANVAGKVPADRRRGGRSRLDIHDIRAFLAHVLARVDWRRDLHFQTRTTIDTLDYSGSGLNEGSKVVIAAAGPAVRELPTTIAGIDHLPGGFRDPRVAMPGVLAVAGPRHARATGISRSMPFCAAFTTGDTINRFPADRDRRR